MLEAKAPQVQRCSVQTLRRAGTPPIMLGVARPPISRSPSKMNRSAYIVVAGVLALASATPGSVAAQTRTFTVVEASIPDMRRALEQKRTTSHEIVRQSL